MRLVDLTLEQFEGNLGHPGHGRGPLLLRGTVSHGTTFQRGIANAYDGAPVSVANEYLVLTGHTGTHVDAPSHVDHKATASVERIPLDRMYGPAVWLDVSAVATARARIDRSALESAEAAGGEPIRPGDIVLIHTGWLAHVNGDVARYVEDSPGLTKDAGDWLRERNIKALGVDLVGPDCRDALDLPIHINFLKPRALGRDESDYVPIFENVANIASIDRRRFTFIGLAIPFRGATGSPVRAVALVDD